MDFGKGFCSRMGACAKGNANYIVSDDFVIPIFGECIYTYVMYCQCGKTGSI